MVRGNASARVGQSDRYTSRRALLGVGAAGSVAATSALLAGWRPGVRVAQAQAGQEIVGVWYGVVRRQGGDPHVSMRLFNADGSFTSQGDDPTRGPGYGIWQRTGDGQFAVTAISLVFLGANGAFSGFQKSRGTYQLNDNQDQLTAMPGLLVDWYDTAGTYSHTTYPESGTVSVRLAFEAPDAPPQQSLPLLAGAGAVAP